jgi:hypothetical protein
MQTVAFQSPFCTGELHAAGGMLERVRFKLGPDRWVSPFATAPWRADAGEKLDALPPLLKCLGNEWVCVPFGIERDIPDLDERWRLAGDNNDSPLTIDPHGFAANHAWQVSSLSPRSAYGRIVYPEGDALVAVERSVTASHDDARLEFSLTLHPRQDVRLPVGVHPVFTLPEQSGTVEVHTGGSLDRLRAWTFPGPLPHAHLAAGQQNCRWDELRTRAGSPVNITALPFAHTHEDQLLLTGLDGSLALRFLDRHYEVCVQWDPAIFPACLLWLSNAARADYPFCGRFRAVGIEPIAAPFDLGSRVAAWRQNPLERSGVATAIDLHAGRPWRTEYAIACRE